MGLFNDLFICIVILGGVVSLYVEWGFVFGLDLNLEGLWLLSFLNFVKLMIRDAYDVDLVNVVL